RIDATCSPAVFCHATDKAPPGERHPCCCKCRTSRRRQDSTVRFMLLLHPYPRRTPSICSSYLPKSLGKTHLPLLEVFLDKYIKLFFFFTLLCLAKNVSFPVFSWLFSTFSALFLPILSLFHTYFFVLQIRFSCFFTTSP